MSTKQHGTSLALVTVFAGAAALAAGVIVPIKGEIEGTVLGFTNSGAYTICDENNECTIPLADGSELQVTRKENEVYLISMMIQNEDGVKHIRLQQPFSNQAANKPFDIDDRVRVEYKHTFLDRQLQEIHTEILQPK